MSEETRGSSALPDAANLDWLRKHAKRRLTELRRTTPDAKLADAQFALAKDYGFSSWRALKAHIDALTVDGQLVEAAKTGDVAKLTALLDAHPDKLRVRSAPYEWTLLHTAASEGQLPVVDLLLRRGLDPNTREKGDNTYAMHWAAAGGHADIVRRLIDAGGDVVGHGDDHSLEVIGWASAWDGCDDDAHREVVNLLQQHGARHNIFSAIAMNLDDEVRRIAAADSAALEQPMSHNEDFQHPLHYAVRTNRPRMVSLLLELGADPLAKDGTGYTSAAYANEPDVDRAVSEALRARGQEDLFAALALRDWNTAERLLRENPGAIARGSANSGALHLMSKRNDAAAVRWLLDHGADPDALWSHWGVYVTPLHLAALHGHTEVARLLLDAGADPTIHDSMHDSDVMGWAAHSRKSAIVQLLTERAKSA